MIFTFYSYKGGVGRSMTLAAVAQVLASRGLKVLAVDFDLEAPGLERYFYGDDESRARRGELGLMDLIRKYREALTDEAAFERAEFKKLDDFIFEAVHEAGSRGGSVHLLSAGRRETPETLREYALAVRNFDWQDFFYNWKGGRFFEWLRRTWTNSTTGYDAVLVDSRTGVTEMGGVCAYQLADAVVLLCAPNYQNLEGTRDVARDFISDSVRGLRQARPLQILTIPARLDPKHPKRDDFLAAFTRELGTLGLPKAVADAGQTYGSLSLPYLPEISVGEVVVGRSTRDTFPDAAVSSFERLADALTLLADPESRLGRHRREALARLGGADIDAATPLQADTTKASSGYDAFIDFGREDEGVVEVLCRQLLQRGLTLFREPGRAWSAGWSSQAERALAYSANLVICFGASAGSEWREALLRVARRNAKLTIVPLLLPEGDLKALRSFGLNELHYLDCRDGLKSDAVEALITTLTSRPSDDPASATADVRNPYPGAGPYREDDAACFFGRENVADDLLASVLDFPIVLLEGPAKVGKTSLVCAGLMPKLRSRVGPDRVLYFNATDESSAMPGWARVAARSRSSDLIIVDHLDSASRADAANWIESIRQVSSVIKRGGQTRHLLVVWRGSLPSDEYDAVIQLWAGQRFTRMSLSPLSGDALRHAIEGPAKAVGQLLENGVVERLVESGGKARSAIFQIQIVLSAMWAARRRGWLTNKSLDALGHLGGYFQQHITQTVGELSDEDRAAAKDLFRALTEVNDRGDWLPQSAAWEDVAAIPSLVRCGAERLCDLLASAGVIDLWRQTSSDTSSGVKPEGSHVSLVRPNTAHYFTAPEIAVDMPFMQWRAILSGAARQWRASGESAEALLPLESISEAKNWLDARGDGMTGRERTFVERSIQARWIDIVVDGARAVGEEAPVQSGQVKETIRRGAGDTGTKVHVSAVPGEDVVVLNLDDGASLMLHPTTARDLFATAASALSETGGREQPASPSAATPEVKPTRPETPSLEGGGLVSRVLRSVQIITGVPQISADLIMEPVVARLDSQVEPGIYELRQNSWHSSTKLRRLPEVPAAADAPALVLVHGTFLDAKTTFGGLWEQHAERVGSLLKCYEGRVVAFEHPTLAAGPVECALALAQACKKGGSLHLLTHSSGGLIADVLALVAARPSMSIHEIMQFSAAVTVEMEALRSLVKLMKKQRLRIARVVRVACPSRGSGLLSRLDVYLATFVTALQQSGAPISDDLRQFTLEVARRRTAAAELPGLAALRPDSPVIRWLHSPDDPIPGDLHVIAGQVTDRLLSRLSAILSDVYWDETDIVVPTRSMFGGVARAGKSTFFLDDSADAQHFRYFRNPRTAKAIVDALVSETPEGFRPIGPLSWAGQSAIGTR